MKWNNPETKLPEENQRVLIKTKYLHDEKIRYARFEKENGFVEMEVSGGGHNPKDVWGWVEFNDSEVRV